MSPRRSLRRYDAAAGATPSQSIQTPSAARPLAPLVVLGLLVAGATGGCASIVYRVPGTEVQRLAELPPMSRGDEVRVVPHDAPLSPSAERLTPPPPVAPPLPSMAPLPMAPPPATNDQMDQMVDVEEPLAPAPVGPGLYVDVAVPVGGPRPYRSAPAVAPAFSRAAPVRAGTMRGTPVASSGWRGTPVSSAPRAPFRPASFAHSSGGHHGGGGGNGAAVVGGVVAVVGLVALIAVAAEHSNEVEEARTFDGWVNTPPTHILHLHYRGNQERAVHLYDLRVEDTIGVQYAFLRGGDGSVKPIARVAAAPRPVAAAAAPPPAPPPPPAAGYRR